MHTTHKLRLVQTKKMPFGLGPRRSLKFSRKKTYSVQEQQISPSREDKSLLRPLKSTTSLVSRGRRSSAPHSILKRAGSRPVSFPALEDGMVPQEMAAAIPMPTEAELNQLFEEMVVRESVSSS